MTGNPAVFIAVLTAVAGGLGVIIGAVWAGARSESADQVAALMRLEHAEAEAARIGSVLAQAAGIAAAATRDPGQLTQLVQLLDAAAASPPAGPDRD
jgi:hypothetical protein